MLALRERGAGRRRRGEFASEERIREGRRPGTGQQLRIQETRRARSVQGAGGLGARIWRASPRSRSRGTSHQGRFRQRFPFENAVAPSLARHLREIVIDPVIALRPALVLGAPRRKAWLSIKGQYPNSHFSLLDLNLDS